jgi:hypothetical protein
MKAVVTQIFNNAKPPMIHGYGNRPYMFMTATLLQVWEQQKTTR